MVTGISKDPELEDPEKHSLGFWAPETLENIRKMKVSGAPSAPAKFWDLGVQNLENRRT